MKNGYRVGAAQFLPRFLDRNYNLGMMQELARQAGTDLLVFPELCTSGYLFGSQAEAARCAEPAFTGPTAQLLAKLATEYNCTYICGFPEKADDKLYNSALMVNPDGLMAVYRKTHLFYEEKLWFTPGNGFKVNMAKDSLPVGMMICFDWIFPEAARTLALQGALLLAQPANLVLPWCQQAMLVRSLENRVFSITANRVGVERNLGKNLYFTGRSQIVSPLGELLAQASEEEETVISAVIDPQAATDKKATSMNDVFADRRPEYYFLKE